MGLDFQAINAAALAQFDILVRQWAPEGRMDGAEWVAINPTRNDRKAGSFKINTATAIWSEFATGDSGNDPVSLYAYLFTGGNQGEAARKLKDDLRLGDNELREYSQNTAPVQRKPDDTPAIEYPPENPPALPEQFKTRDGEVYPVVARWAYKDAEGRLLGFACRLEKPDGGKDVLVCRWIDGRWRWKGFPKPRPLYGLDTMPAEGVVLLVEGEKTADAARAAGVAAVTWPGGSKALKYADVSPLAGRKVLLVPDADETGVATMFGYYDKHGRFVDGAAQALHAQGCEVKIARPDPDAPKGWDIADREWQDGELKAWLIERVQDYTQPEHPEPDPEPPEYDEPPIEVYDDTGEPDGSEAFMPAAEPFRYMGYSRGSTGQLRHHFLPARAGMVVTVPATGMSRSALVELAPTEWWQSRFPAKTGFDLEMATNALINRSLGEGPFNPDRCRGRGAWWDNGRPLIHLGDAVHYDGTDHTPEEVPSWYIYERDKPLTVELEGTLSNAEAAQLTAITDMLTWERPVNSRLFSGWLVCAAICGALKWRPHIWLTGGAGTGKSTVMDEIAQPILGELALFVQGETTEAGIRQAIKQDARPILMDEAESERKNSATRMENVLALATQASSDTGAVIVKGTANGQAQQFRIRSCFAFSSIAVNIKQHAAMTRIAVLALRRNMKPDADEHYKTLVGKIADTINPEYCRKLRGRAIHLIPVIRKNAEIFGDAASVVLGSKRLGDQYGALLAGAYALHSTSEINFADAKAWVEKQDWTEERSIDEVSDERGCLAHLMQHVMKINSGRATVERSIGELVNVLMGALDVDLHTSDARAAVERLGVKVDNGMVCVSNTHTGIKNLMAGTQWGDGWARTLARLEGAVKLGPTRFGPATVSRGVGIPDSIVTGGA